MESTNIHDVIIDTREHAEDVLDHMKSIARTYASVTRADFYDLLDLHSNYNDTGYYWTINMLNNCQIEQTKDGWIIELPTPLLRKHAKVTYRSYNYPKPEPSPVYISIHTLEVEDLDCALNSVMKQVTDHPELKFYIDIN